MSHVLLHIMNALLHGNLDFRSPGTSADAVISQLALVGAGARQREMEAVGIKSINQSIFYLLSSKSQFNRRLGAFCTIRERNDQLGCKRRATVARNKERSRLQRVIGHLLLTSCGENMERERGIKGERKKEK